MKFSRIIANLHNSTKATVIACSVIIAMTAVALFFLMLFPIKARDKSSALSAPIIIETTTQKVPAVKPSTTREPSHTLSTWAATAETLDTTSDPDGIPWYDKIFTTTTQTDIYGNIIKVTTTKKSTTTTQPPEELPETFPEEPATISEPIVEPPEQTITEVIATEEPPVTAPAIPFSEEFANAELNAPEN